MCLSTALVLVGPAVMLSARIFSWNWIIRFLQILAWCYKALLSQVVRDGAGFFGKPFFCLQNLENGPKISLSERKEKFRR